MLIKFGSIVTQGRGKLGGHVYSKNRQGAYIRTNAVPSNPQTASQQTIRLFLTQFSQAWSNLSTEQIAGWNDAAKLFVNKNVFGDDVIPSGKNLFTGLNQTLAYSGQATLEDAPTPQTIQPPPFFTIDANPGSIVLKDFNVSEDTTVVFMATPPVSRGTSYVKNRLRVISTEELFLNTETVDLSSQYEAKFGAVDVGDKVFFAAYSVNSVGQRSVIFKTNNIVAAIV